MTTPADEREAEQRLTEAGVEGPPVLLHPGSAWPLKNWQPRRWDELGVLLAERYGVTPLVAGTSGEAALVQAVVDASAGRCRALGDVSLGGLAAVHRRTRLVVMTDSGPMHVAAMMGAPVIGLFRPGEPALFRPWAPEDRSRVMRMELPCARCGTLELPPCGAVTDPACVDGISVGAVAEACDALLRRRRYATTRGSRGVSGSSRDDAASTASLTRSA